MSMRIEGWPEGHPHLTNIDGYPFGLPKITCPDPLTCKKRDGYASSFKRQNHKKEPINLSFSFDKKDCPLFAGHISLEDLLQKQGGPE